MKIFLVALKWAFFILVALGLGIAAGVPAGTRAARFEGVEASTLGFTRPLVEFTDTDYRASDGSVPDLRQWGRSPITRSYEQDITPASITRDLRLRFLNEIVATAVAHGELREVVQGCASTATATATGDSAPEVDSHGRSHAPLTLLVRAEKAEYFGQDAWIFLSLTTADHHRAIARVMVVSAAPNYGLLHQEVVGQDGGD